MIIDFEKAFDSVSHTCLQKVLFTFGFGPSFCRWVETLIIMLKVVSSMGAHLLGNLILREVLDRGNP